MSSAIRYDFEKAVFIAATDRLSASRDFMSHDTFNLSGLDALKSVLKDRKVLPHRENIPLPNREITEYLQRLGSFVELAAGLDQASPPKSE